MNIRMKLLGVAMLVSISTILSVSSTFGDTHNSSIIGTWVSQEDPAFKMVFNDKGKCYWYTKGKLSDSFDYTISNSSPQCGTKVLVNTKTSYLRLKDLSDNENYCYEINGITEKHLSLRTLDMGGADVYIRQ